MPWLIFVPNTTTSYILRDRDSQYLRYFSLWGWRIETLEADAVDPPVSPLLDPFKEQRLYHIWRNEVNRRLNEEQGKAEAVRAEVKARGSLENDGNVQAEGEGGKTERSKKGRGWSKVFKRGKKGKQTEVDDLGADMEVNYLEDMQRRWS
ncbi:hypothetical protein K504DRAFT_464093 [Pleomassaria siparia CBS 279.74]|uniref:Uncharacterized protein n=1 Tax=Pleomassaria siparia CBS 279.74 TaxID=1314801 RepID=A0A6G1KGM8_9PLEO|nr:hypothetical protein K504DRAFT_464093 [Pleomassaria siparia CBS 279.74]